MARQVNQQPWDRCLNLKPALSKLRDFNFIFTCSACICSLLSVGLIKFDVNIVLDLFLYDYSFLGFVVFQVAQKAAKLQS